MAQQGEVSRLRVSLGLESIDFSRGMRDANNRIKALNSELRVITTSSDRFDDALGNLRQQSTVLTNTMTVHRAKVEQLRREYEESVRVNGENADATVRLVTQYNQAQAAMNRTEQQLRNVNEQIQEQSSEFGQLSQTVNQNVSSITSELRLLESGFNASTAGVEGFGDEVEHLQQQQEHLTQSLSLQQRRVEELARLHQASAEATGANSEETQELQLRLNGATQAMRETELRLNQTTQSIEEQSNVWNRLGDRVSEFGERTQGIGQGIKDVGTTLTTSLTLPIAGIGTGLGLMAADSDNALGKIQASLGVTKEEAEKLKETARAIWKNGFGENIGQVASDLSIVKKNMEDLPLDKLQEATEQAYFFADTFEQDINDVTKTAGQLMTHFGLKSNEAFDLMTVGFQNGLDYSGEFLDTLNEYSPQFAALGFSGKEFFDTLASGAQEGAFNLDKVGDAVKEFTIRSKDMSDSSKEGFKALGMNADDMFKKFSSGGKVANDAFYEVVTRLSELRDPLQKNTVGVQLFGTQFEDLEAGVIAALGTTSGLFENVEGATKKAGDALYDNFGARMTTVFRDLQEDLLPVGEDLLEIAEDTLPVLAETVGKVTGAFAEMSPEGQKTALAIAGVAAAAGPVVFTIGTLTTGIGTLAGAVTPLITAIGAGGLAGGLTALAGPVGLTVAGLGLATGAVFAIKGAMDESKEVNLEYASSLLDQSLSLEDLTSKYEALREKNSLSNNELLRFRDIQGELKTSSSADEITRLKDEAEKLTEKSGLSNEQLSEMLRLNDQLIEKVPTAGQAFSDQGSKILKNTDDLHLANEALRENLQLELEIQQTKAEAKLDENIRNQITAYEELNVKIHELNNAKIDGAAKEYQLEQLKKQQQDAYAAGQDHIAEGMNLEIERLEIGIGKQNNKVSAIANEVQEKQKSVGKTEEEIAKTQTLFGEMINLQLAQAGINTKGQEGINQLDLAISKTSAQIVELRKVEQAQGGLNGAQQKELNHLNTALNRYGQAQSSIKGIQSEQEVVNTKIDAGARKAGDMSDILSASEIKDIKFTGDGYTDAKRISDEAERKANKTINVTDGGKAQKIHDTAEKDATKAVVVTFRYPNGTSPRISGPQQFAKGTRYAPEGMAWVGEEGPELMYLPGGSRIIPNRQSEQLLRSWNIPMLATGGDVFSGGLALVGERGRELLQYGGARTRPLNYGSNSPNQSVNVNIQPAPIYLDGYEIAQVTFNHIDGMQQGQFSTEMTYSGVKT
ncbi:phage tail tape measure protein [Bacillus sp. PAMC26568]|nr:phage tail tape measure protein [Bacillus sp. PAMC26568]